MFIEHQIGILKYFAEGWCDAEDWSNSCCKFSFASQK